MSVFELMKVPFIGPKKAFKLVKALSLNNPVTVVADLKEAAIKKQIAPIEGFVAPQFCVARLIYRILGRIKAGRRVH